METSDTDSESSDLTARTAGAILIVDGEAEKHAQLRGFLDEHYRVFEARDVASAIDLIERDGIDLVLLRIRAFSELRKQGEVIRHQLEELRAMESLKDDLVSLIAHDLRNPLAGLSVLLHSVARDVGDPELERDLSAALSAADRLRSTIDDMLEVRLLEEGKVALQLCRLSARTVVLEAIATLAEVAAERAVAIAEKTENDLIVELDAKLVRRSVENLIANAIKYSPDNAVIDVCVRGLDRGVEIEVADRGPGIPDSLKSSLFQKFGFAAIDPAEANEPRGATAPARTAGASRGRRGFGLGLYLVNLVATIHRGSVAVEDRAGGGARFVLFFPQR